MDNNNMQIQTTYNDKFQCNWYHCKIKNETFSSPRIKDVEEWREDKIVNAEYYDELQVLHDKAMQHMYNTNPTNYTGD